MDSGRFKIDCTTENEICGAHNSTLFCICVTCGNVGLCLFCIGQHCRHQLVPYGEIRNSLLNLLSSSKHDQKKLEDALLAICMMSERVEASVQVC